jgi:hypothetical protein
MHRVLQVARLVPFLITSLERMQPYAGHPSAAAALEAAGPGAVAALMAVLAAGDPTDWPMLPHEVDGYRVWDLAGMCCCCSCCRLRACWHAVAGVFYSK